MTTILNIWNEKINKLIKYFYHLNDSGRWQKKNEELVLQRVKALTRIAALKYFRLQPHILQIRPNNARYILNINPVHVQCTLIYT